MQAACSAATPRAGALGAIPAALLARAAPRRVLPGPGHTCWGSTPSPSSSSMAASSASAKMGSASCSGVTGTLTSCGMAAAPATAALLPVAEQLTQFCSGPAQVQKDGQARGCRREVGVRGPGSCACGLYPLRKEDQKAGRHSDTATLFGLMSSSGDHLQGASGPGRPPFGRHVLLCASTRRAHAGRAAGSTQSSSGAGPGPALHPAPQWAHLEAMQAPLNGPSSHLPSAPTCRSAAAGTSAPPGCPASS